MRRDFGVLLGMIEAHAVLHQCTRERDGAGRIVATDADYQAARGILAVALAVGSGRQVRPAVRRAVVAVKTLGGETGDVTIAEVARHLKRDRTGVTRALAEAADLGHVTNKETKPGQRARYRTAADLPEDEAALPAELPGDTDGGCAE